MAYPKTVREISENEDYSFGLTFPLTYNNQLGGFFPTSKTLRQQVSSNIKNLLLTAKVKELDYLNLVLMLPLYCLNQ